MRSLLAIAIAAALLASACGDSNPAVEFPRYLGEPNGDDAAMIGELVIENNCLYVRTEAGELVLTAFPSDFAEWDGERQVLSLSGKDVPLGEVFVFGGSGMDMSRASNARWSTPPHEGCAEGQSYIWLSQEDAVPISERPDWFRPGKSNPDIPFLFPPTPAIANP